jgi:hypothetical protein
MKKCLESDVGYRMLDVGLWMWDVGCGSKNQALLNILAPMGQKHGIKG